MRLVDLFIAVLRDVRLGRMYVIKTIKPNLNVSTEIV